MDQTEQYEMGERGQAMLPEHDPQLRDQVTRLVSVLRQLATSRNAPVRHTARYDHVLWLDGVAPHLRDGAELLRLARPVGAPEPPAPRSIRRWLRPPTALSDIDDVPAPALRDRGPLHGQQAYLVDAPGVRDAYDRWMATTWLPWANAERRRRPLQRVHEQLVEMHRTAADRPESVELVLAAGLLHAPGPDVADGLRVHLVSQPVRIEPDPETGELVCTVTGVLRLEADELLGGLPIHAAQGSAGMARRLAELVDSPLSSRLATFLHEWSLRALTTACTVDPGWTPPTGPAVRLAAAPALVARRRGASAVREHYDAMLRALRDEQVPVPPGLAQLVRPIEPAQRRAWLDRAGADLTGFDDPLFPLPATAGHTRIMTRLGGDTGVVVEGAAGTGKTHTAANLLGALLANGQRVLVTGDRAQPLQLLAEMLPLGIRELCATVTDPDPDDLTATVATLAAQRAEFDPGRADRRIAELTECRAAAAQERSRGHARMRAAREFETLAHPEVAPGYGGTPAQIARMLARTAERDGWVPGPARGRPPVDEAELVELLTLLHTETPARSARRDQYLPDALPRADALAALAAALSRGTAARAGADPDIVAVLERLPAGARPDIVGAEMVGAVAALRALPGLGTWAEEITDSLLGGGGRTHGWERAIAQLVDVEDALAQDRVAGPAHVEVRSDVHLAAAAGILDRLVVHLADGTTLRRMFKCTEQRDAERLGSGVLVDGAPPRSREAAHAAANHLRVLDTARNIDASFAPLRTGLPLDADRGNLVDAMVALREACTAVGRVRAAAVSMARLLGSLPRPAPSQVAVLEEFGAAALAVGPVRDAVRAGRELDAVVATLEAGADPAPETVALLEAVRRLDVGAYSSALDSLRPARRERDDQRRCDELLGRLRAAAPELDLLDQPAEEWAERLPRWRRAWARACAATWLAERTAEHAVEVSDAGEVDALTADLAVERAWRACLGRMDENQVQALGAHRDAMARLADGTGPHAERFRAAAAAATAVVAPAVPAWIMPIQQVLARTAPGPDRFDVVIVDDAGLCDLTSAFLLWLAPRVIVLGDDRQHAPAPSTSPSSVLDRIDVELPDVPVHLRAAFGAGADLLSLLRFRFGPVERLRRDHRGRPGVLAWSVADAPPAPMRPPSAAPPVRATHVPDGRIDPVAGGAVNRAEARAVAESVVAQAATGGDATFGVISLLGRPQADLITEELRDRLAPAEWMRRRVRVGVPADFQGDERDVVWLSLVAAPHVPPHPPAGADARNGLAVAASRARELLWVFHSVTPDGLDPTDVRRSLLDHARIPAVPAGSRGDATPFAARVRADLVALGYRVAPQVALDGRVVDLVVTAPAGTVVVTCDGESRRVSPEARAVELESELELRRSGWLVERVRESVYLVDRDTALAPVLAALGRLAVLAPAGPSPMVTAPLPTGSVATRRLPTAVTPVPVPVSEPEPEPVTERVAVAAGPPVGPEPVTAAVPVAAVPVAAVPVAAVSVAAVPVAPVPVAAAAPFATVLPAARPTVEVPGIPPVPVGAPAGRAVNGLLRSPRVRRPADTAEPTPVNGMPVPGRPAGRTGSLPVDRRSTGGPPPPARYDSAPDPDLETPPDGTVVVPPPRVSVDRPRAGAWPATRGRHALIEDPADAVPAVEPVDVPGPRQQVETDTDASVVVGPAADEDVPPSVPGADDRPTPEQVATEPECAAPVAEFAEPDRKPDVGLGDDSGQELDPVAPDPVAPDPVVPDPVAPDSAPEDVPSEVVPSVGLLVPDVDVFVPVVPEQVDPEPDAGESDAAGPDAGESDAAESDAASPEDLPRPVVRDLRSVPEPVARPGGYPSMFDAPLVVPATVAALPESVQVEDRRLLLHAAISRPLTSRWVARALAVEVAEARALLRSMTEEGLLRHVVQASGTHYVLPPGPASTLAPADIRGRERVLGTARERPLTVAAVRNLLGVGADSAREILADLVAQGDLVERGRGRVVHYVPAGAA